MNFISWPFVFLFLPIFLFRCTLGRRGREGTMLGVTALGSTLFVLWHVPVYILVMVSSISVDYIAARLIADRPVGSPRQKLWLFGAVGTNLLLLAVFKYSDFFFSVSEEWLRICGVRLSLPRLSLLLPMGISFYTFCSMSYTIDVYRGRIRPARRFFDFYYFITFFPHLVSGPIIRAEEFLYQLYRPRRLHMRAFLEGAYLIIRGMFLKMVCADRIGIVLAPRWNNASRMSPLDALFMVLLFAAQIYSDFEGYTSIARGLAYWMGFRFPINFRGPYLAQSFSDFWKRWHITLSSWLRDYLYIPMGGNRRGGTRTYANLLVVMLLGGLWHGAGWTFIAWGAIHGGALVLERLLGLDKLAATPAAPLPIRLCWFLAVQATILVAWVFFRSKDLHQGLAILHRISALVTPGAMRKTIETSSLDIRYALIFLLPVATIHIYLFFRESGRVRPVPGWIKSAMSGAMLYASIVAYGASSEFIYFQF